MSRFPTFVSSRSTRFYERRKQRDTSNLVSFCGDDVRKLGETRFEMKKSDYTPDGNLSILILKKLPPQ
ncbi:MAG: DUF4424 family protein [Xanthobacteraceae bacterium]